MKDVYEDYFSFGIFGRGEIDGLIYNYASYTPGNEMKPESTQAEKGVFTFGPAEAAMAVYAAETPDLKFSGHTLAWHSQTPTWMWDAPPARFGQPGTFDRAVALENLDTHVETVLGHFGDGLEAVDVVNEAIGTADPSDWRGSLAMGQGWYQALGSEWVELAFLRASAVVDENGWDVKLTYNDFSLDNPAKAQVVYEMVKDINERYADVRPNGRPLIEVIGMQGHYNLTTDVAAVEQNIKLFGTLENVEVHVTEMDVALPPGELTPENENNQGMKYAELFQVYRDHAVGPGNTTSNPHVVSTVKLAGVRDVETGWKGGEFAMPYDYDGNAKLALLGILYPSEFLAAYEYIDTSDGEELPPVPGVHVFDTGQGDAWSGANIVLGDDDSVWPWSTTDDGEVAFEPEPGATYRVAVNYTAKGTTAIRVRWVKDNTNNTYTLADDSVINDHQYGAGEVATHIPAYFNSGMVNMGSYDLVTEIELDGSQAAEGLIGNIAIRGGGGGNAFSINAITVEKVGDAGDELLVNWPESVGEPESPFVDVPSDNLFAEEIRWLFERGTTTGWTLEDGSVEYRPLSPVNRDAMAAFLFREFGEEGYVAPEVSPFVDVAVDDQFFREIAWLAESGISTGWETPAGPEFRPVEQINRDAMAAFLFRIAAPEAYVAPSDSPFTDVTTSTRYFTEIMWAAEAGITRGWEGNDGTALFQPLSPIARDAMAAFLHRMIEGPDQG